MKRKAAELRIMNLTGKGINLIDGNGAGMVVPGEGIASVDKTVSVVDKCVHGHIKLCKCEEYVVHDLPAPRPGVLIIVPEDVAHAAKAIGRDVSDLVVVGGPVYTYHGSGSRLRGYRYLIKAETL